MDERPPTTGVLPAKWDRRWRRVRLLFAYGGGFLVAVGTGYAFPVQTFSAHYKHVVAGWLAVAIGLFCLAVFTAVETLSSNPIPTESPDDVSDHQLFAAFPVDGRVVLPCIRMIVEPRAYFREIIEKITPHAAYYTREVELVVELPDADLGEMDELPYLVPVLTHTRGDQIDDISLTGESHGALPLLSDLESRGALESLLDQYASTLVDLTDAEVAKALTPVRDSIRRDGPLPESPERRNAGASFDRSLVTSLKQGPLWDQSRTDWRRAIGRLGDLCAWAVDNHALFVPLVGRPGERITLSLKYQQPEAIASGGLKNWLRNLIGLQPYIHRLRIPQYLRTASYNAVFQCPPAQYVYTARVLAADDNQWSAVVSATRGWGALDYASVKIRPIRPGALEPTRVTSLFIDARERPPGLVGVTALVSMAQFALIWVFGIFHNSFFPSGGDTGATHCVLTIPDQLLDRSTNPPSLSSGVAHLPVLCHAAAHFEVTTLLLALPALLAGWVAARFSRDQMQWTSLAPILGMACTGLLAIASTALALWKSSGHSLHDQLWFVSHPIWAFLMVSSAILTADMLVRALTRSLRFRRRLAHAGAVARYRI